MSFIATTTTTPGEDEQNDGTPTPASVLLTSLSTTTTADPCALYTSGQVCPEAAGASTSTSPYEAGVEDRRGQMSVVGFVVIMSVAFGALVLKRLSQLYQRERARQRRISDEELNSSCGSEGPRLPQVVQTRTMRSSSSANLYRNNSSAPANRTTTTSTREELVVLDQQQTPQNFHYTTSQGRIGNMRRGDSGSTLATSRRYQSDTSNATSDHEVVSSSAGVPTLSTKLHAEQSDTNSSTLRGSLTESFSSLPTSMNTNTAVPQVHGRSIIEDQGMGTMKQLGDHDEMTTPGAAAHHVVGRSDREERPTTQKSEDTTNVQEQEPSPGNATSATTGPPAAVPAPGVSVSRPGMLTIEDPQNRESRRGRPPDNAHSAPVVYVVVD
ncbi:unnamed protein product [Amoebophrya sp. A120]|nr:unnamed protein product [Amoebophrya sp. A120]|eukprot:GSA120T00000841001.1